MSGENNVVPSAGKVWNCMQKLFLNLFFVAVV